MSTKIYNAYKYEGNLSSLIILLKDIRMIYQEQKIDFISNLIKLEVKIEDGKKVFLKDLYNEILGEMFLAETLEDIMKKGYNEPLNIGASAVVYSHNNDLYVQFFGIKSDYKKSISSLKDFHYQNQTDMSNYDWDKEEWKDMSKERQKELDDDWDHRRKVWDEIIGDDTFGESGLTFDFHPSGYNMTVFCNKILKKIKERNYDTQT